MPNNTPKWTPGPWGASARAARDICADADGTGELIATAYVMDQDRDTDDDEATGKCNAAVMAAAPDLYDALALYVEHFGDPLKVARTALAKARGESDAE
jgi:hypothetical protein